MERIMKRVELMLSVVLPTTAQQTAEMPGPKSGTLLLASFLRHDTAAFPSLSVVGGKVLTDLGAAGADAFTIQWRAGHSSVTVALRYMCPMPEGWKTPRLPEALKRSMGQVASIVPQREFERNYPGLSLRSKQVFVPY
jgi:hypothetical protein